MQHHARLDGLGRSTSTIPLNASDGESGSDLGRAFGFSFFSCLLFFHVLFYFDENILRALVGDGTDGVAVSNGTHSLGTPLSRARAGERGLSRCTTRGEKEKRRLGSDFERKGAGGADDDEGVSTLRHACVRAGEQGPRGGHGH